jgi:hypothetical protein
MEPIAATAKRTWWCARAGVLQHSLIEPQRGLATRNDPKEEGCGLGEGLGHHLALWTSRQMGGQGSSLCFGKYPQRELRD